MGVKDMVNSVITFKEIVGLLEIARKDGNEAQNKRSDIRKMLPDLDSVELPGSDRCLHMSLGYVERLLRKLNHEFPGTSLQSLTLHEYSEGCGFFYGNLTWEEQGEVEHCIRFDWKGSGAIETSWDCFPTWEACANERVG